MLGRGIVLILGLVLTGADGPRGDAPDTPFDRILFRDRLSCWES